jgi:hypothetical protein
MYKTYAIILSTLFRELPQFTAKKKKKKSAELASLLLQKKRSEKKIEFNRLHMNYKSE